MTVFMGSNDKGVRIYYDPTHRSHDPGHGHAERPVRLDACLETLGAIELQEPGPAARADLERVHDPHYLDMLEALCDKGGGWITPDTFAGRESLAVATRAAGAVCEGVDAALSSKIRSLCLVRPPGHHASRDRAMGFCLLNHAAAGAAMAVNHEARVMIFDFDVHHGNGTQEMFWDEPKVLYVSIHQWPWYPYRTGAREETGGQKAEGTNLNIPLPAGSGDREYLRAIEVVVVPEARAFRPDLVLLSAGFDAHERDPLSHMSVTTGGFAAIVRAAVGLADELCEGRVVATLEGGYDLRGLSEGVTACLGALYRRIGSSSRDPSSDMR